MKKKPPPKQPINPTPQAVQGAAFELRQRAEKRLEKQSTHSDNLSAQDTLRLVHELQVHQIELEMQNEELLQSRAEVEAGLERYTDLYDFAPVGYFSLTNNGTIRQLNLTGAELLGVERANLIGRRLGLFVTIESLPKFNHFLEQVFLSRIKQVCEVSLLKENNQLLWVRIEGRTIANAQDCLAAVVDITERRKAEEEVKHLNLELEERVKERTGALANANRELEQRINEGIKAQEALGDLYTRYRIIADNTYDWEYWLDEKGQYRYISPSCERITGYKPDDFLSRPNLLQRIIYPDDLPGWQKHCDEETGKKTVTQVEFRILRADGSTSWIGHVCQPVYDWQGIYLGIRGSNRDINERKKAENDIRNHAARAESLLHVSARLNARLELDTLLKTLCQEVASALHAPAVWINLYEPEQDQLCFSGDYGMPPGFNEHYQPRSRADYDLSAAQMGAIVVIADAQALVDNPNQALYHSYNIRTVVTGSMIRDGQLIGVLNIISFGECRKFSEDELTLLKGLTEQAAQAVVNTRLFEQVSAGQQRLRALSKALIEIQETERRTLALELHDEFGQALSAAKMSVAIISTLPQDSVDRQLERVQTILGDLVGRVRRLALELRPSMLDDKGLLPALLWLFDSYQAQSGETVSFEHIGMNRRFPPQVEITAYRIVQEALTNIIRHAGNRRVAVHAWADEQSLNLQIQDFGVGFNPAVTLSNSTSSGLSGMYERARLVDGKITIESAPGKGTNLLVRLPIMAVIGSV